MQVAPPLTAPARPGGGPWPVIAAVLVGCWAVAVTVGAQAIGWLVEQLLLVGGLTQPAWVWPVTGVVNAVLVGVPAGLLAALPRSAAIRAAGRVWLIGGAALGGFGLLRVIPLAQHEGYLAALAVAAALAAVLVRWQAGRSARSRITPPVNDANDPLLPAPPAPPATPTAPPATLSAGTGLAAAGVFFAVAAGNTGPRCGSIADPPAPYPDVFTVGAVDRERRVAPFSSRGPAADGAAKPDPVAPGADVLSAMPGGGYATLSGTSMAAHTWPGWWR
jgi:hypothetical protein